MASRDPAWLRSWTEKDGSLHVEVRDPKLQLEVVKSYRGKDHTLHIILKKEATR